MTDIAKAAAIAHKLIGPVGSIKLTDAINDLTLDETRALDAIAFECVGCGWWFAVHERHEVKDVWLCAECAK